MNENRVVRFDWAMKYMLRNKANYDIVEGFLCALLEDNDLKVIEILESESNKEDEDDKFNRVDVLVKDSQGRNIIIEIQNSRESDYLYRVLYGVSKNIAQSIESGQAYKNISKVITVNVLYFNLGIGEDYLYYGSTEFVGMTTNERISKDNERLKKLIPEGASYNPVEIYPEYYLIQVEKYKNIVSRAIDEWIYWFKNEQVREDSKSKNIKKVREKLAILKMSQEERVEYEKYLEKLASERDILRTAYEDGRKKTLKELMPIIEQERKEKAEAKRKEAEAKRKAEQERKEKEQAIQREKEAMIKLAKKMKKYGETIEDIMKETGLSDKEIEKL
jgi:hypothetical protein